LLVCFIYLFHIIPIRNFILTLVFQIFLDDQPQVLGIFASEAGAEEHFHKLLVAFYFEDTCISLYDKNFVLNNFLLYAAFGRNGKISVLWRLIQDLILVNQVPLYIGL